MLIFEPFFYTPNIFFHIQLYIHVVHSYHLLIGIWQTHARLKLIIFSKCEIKRLLENRDNSDETFFYGCVFALACSFSLYILHLSNAVE